MCFCVEKCINTTTNFSFVVIEKSNIYVLLLWKRKEKELILSNGEFHSTSSNSQHQEIYRERKAKELKRILDVRLWRWDHNYIKLLHLELNTTEYDYTIIYIIVWNLKIVWICVLFISILWSLLSLSLSLFPLPEQLVCAAPIAFPLIPITISFSSLFLSFILTFYVSNQIFKFNNLINKTLFLFFSLSLILNSLLS